MNTTRKIAKAMKDASKAKTSAYDTTAVVKRIEGNTAWVHIPGGVDETPVRMTINAKVGDSVQVRVSDGSAWLAGNASAPPTDDTTAFTAVNMAGAAKDEAESAHKAATEAWGYAEEAKSAAATAETHASEAKVSAQNASEYAARALGNLSTVQSVAETLTWITQHGTMTLTTDVALDPTHVYFVQDAGGDYVVGGVTYAVVTEPDVADIATYYELTIDESLNNYVGTHLALTSEGLWLLPASSGTNKVLIATGAGSVYTTAGTYIIDSLGATVASFRANGATIGQVVAGEYNTNIDSTGVDIRNNTTSVAKFGSTVRVGESDKAHTELDGRSQVFYAYDGTTEVARIGSTRTWLGTPPSSTLGRRKAATDQYDSSRTYTVGEMVIYSGYDFVCKETISTPEAFNINHWAVSIGNYSVAEGDSLIACGDYSHAEGWTSSSVGRYSHAEGGSSAFGKFSHSEGNLCHAYSDDSHVEGKSTTTKGDASHSEGNRSSAWGDYSHAQNYGTDAHRRSQTAIGEYNILDYSGADGTVRGAYALIIGNGTADNARSNALTVDWSGDVCLALDTTAASGTDHDLYAAITALGWQNDVIV